MLAVAAISVAAWSRGPDRRSHLGNFVQRLLDGDALDVVVRKAVASAETIVTPVGIGCLIWGVVALRPVPRSGERLSLDVPGNLLAFLGLFLGGIGALAHQRLRA